MFDQINNYYFWFSQPAAAFSPEDKFLLIKFASTFGVGLILWIISTQVKDSVIRKLLMRFVRLSLTIGASGLFWVGLRFENTPIFSLRYWAGLILLIGLVWLLFIFKYLIWQFRKDRTEMRREQLKNKYLPNKK
ncbi:MAG: hypothetical protein A3J07_01420 [Candidatus Doudnabacteria bacterium RIFCSPLOWO2_02_FULL_49_13]|uniref:Uncharacterized protein n=1 Tax=Candidatus Doudnabacteria bacterium RIFCSPHIGHO2_12_FULL_48_16 TaxID=1817838 RepID=A0A1F5PKC4_9BACT|nr:MAG: hypothetical protein A3B77_04345 [Candidatus Doudnabacteria bacterium RIFCSPHIGHO2_02_FULL_49_24]OGE88710.1 MAG: hypothetical protein A2760_02005 [Candidatus Doudnabacteria bacterium RIFCSPHIGHO2_01_FULL_50_67]OGE90395.1 MAG: hypothetical protein A3E29_04925 [Candidatus Doudnabacteria bacterium RIFCSPHIGHO2_12_FULL_48_16]OGE97102.1 MAG: hypothetical protein A2990_01915 [Candidatus Doudnabacteria bacterium RIFCSPLOWO2_01_FULL_49_40]OGF02450.1 MAG: hypothetical protein A3J07_01420 [Candid